MTPWGASCDRDLYVHNPIETSSSCKEPNHSMSADVVRRGRRSAKTVLRKAKITVMELGAGEKDGKLCLEIRSRFGFLARHVHFLGELLSSFLKEISFRHAN